ncbi:hypothetical protein ACOI1C_18430 [Bacillus sp. DJP31]|uniref:hypothetical protein n=1 Tax=Bacillus sp. DJP31 TaxID=3409789 RepID=UPI003BB4D341
MSLIQTKGLLFLLLFVVLVAGCSSYNENASYKKSAINENFPVPDNAEQVEVDFDNANIENGVAYNLQNIGGEQGLC